MAVDEKFFYSNAIEVAVSPFDINLKFIRNGTATPAQVVPVNTPVDATPIVQEAMVVAISPSSLKTMLPGLLQAVAIYEQKFGAIPIASDALARWNAAVKPQP